MASSGRKGGRDGLTPDAGPQVTTSRPIERVGVVHVRVCSGSVRSGSVDGRAAERRVETKNRAARLRAHRGARVSGHTRDWPVR